jgi:hypothetical protein
VTNDGDDGIVFGTVILDVSYHFMAFILLPNNSTKPKSSKINARKFTTENINNFKQNLQTQTWDSELSCNDVNDSYNLFWDTSFFF